MNVDCGVPNVVKEDPGLLSVMNKNPGLYNVVKNCPGLPSVMNKNPGLSQHPHLLMICAKTLIFLSF